MSRPLKIAMIVPDNRDEFGCHSIPVPVFGPAPEALLNGLASTPEVEVHVLSCTRRPMQAPERIAGNIRFHLLPVPRIGWLRSAYQGCIRTLRRRIRGLEVDVVHGQGTERYCALAAVFSGKPNVVTIHGNMRHVARLYRARPFSFHWMAARLESFTLPRTGGVLCNSAYTEAAVRPLARRSWRIPNALRPLFFQPPTPAQGAPPVLLNVGVIGSMKRQLELLRLASALHALGLRFELRFIGRFSADHASESFRREIAAAEASGFARHIQEMDQAQIIGQMDAASALIHVSSEESFGLVVAEALARGAAFFGFAVGGVPDIASGIKGSTLLPDGDWRALGDALSAWLRSGAPRSPEAPPLMRERYHPGVIARQHVAVYNEILRTGHPA